MGSGSCCGPWCSLWAMAAICFGVVAIMGHCCQVLSIGLLVDMGGGAVRLWVGTAITVR